MENELEKALENKFFCPSRFAQEIESLVHTGDGMSYIDAVVHFWCTHAVEDRLIPQCCEQFAVFYRVIADISTEIIGGLYLCSKD